MPQSYIKEEGKSSNLSWREAEHWSGRLTPPALAWTHPALREPKRAPHFGTPAHSARAAHSLPPPPLQAQPLKLPQEEQRDVSAGGQHPPSSLLFGPRAKLATERPVPGRGPAFPAAGQHPRCLPPGDGDRRRADLRAPLSARGEGRRARRGLHRLPQTTPWLQASWSRRAAWPQHQAGITSTALCYYRYYWYYCY